MKRIGTYLLYVLGLMFLVYYGVNHLEQLRITAGREFNPIPPLIFASIYSVIIGAYLALPQFLNMLKSVGNAQVDWLKILIIGIPTLLVSLSCIFIYYVNVSFLTSMFQWIYLKFNMTGTVFIGVASGYTLLSSFAKKEIADSAPTRKAHMAKILSLVIFVGAMLYLSLNGVIHPIKLAQVHADIVEIDDQEGYLVNDGQDTVYLKQTKIDYRFEFENIPYSKMVKQLHDDQIAKIEPNEKLQSLLQDYAFGQRPSVGISSVDNRTEVTITYTIGSIDPKGMNQNIDPPPPEVLKEIKDSLYDAVLVLELNAGKTKRYDLLDYKEY